MSGSRGDGSGWTELVRAGEVAPPTQAVLDRTTAAVREAVVREAAVPEAAHGGARRPGRRRRVAPVTVTVTVAAAVAVAVAFGGRPDAEPVQPPVRTPMAVPATPPVPTSPADGGAASCAYSFDLRRQGFALDGTVTAVAAENWGVLRASRVTFAVHHWYRGGRGPAATVVLTPSGALSEDGPTPPLAYAVGTRLLVSGNFNGSPPVLLAWAVCGPYTRPYDPAAAAEWQYVFGPR